MEPIMITRVKDTENENSVKVERFEKGKEYMEKDIGDGIIQRYLRSRGRNRELDRIEKTVINARPRININTQNSSKVNINFCQNSSQTVETNNLRNNESQKNISTINEQVEINFVNGGLRVHNINVNEEKKKSYTKPTVIRLEYKTRYDSSKKPNIAYCLVNKEYVEPLIRVNSKEVLEKYTTLCTLQTNKKHTFEIFIMAGESLKPYEFYANEIIQLLQKLYKLQLKTIVMDFMKDERGIIYFLGVKAFTPVREPEDIGPGYNMKDYIKDENNIRKLYKTWTCKLCQLSYPKAKITKVVTFKLLMNLKENLAKRGKGIFSHINNSAFNESLSCRVCDLCYKLLITEQELMEVKYFINI
jgi:hypothetical protein